MCGGIEYQENKIYFPQPDARLPVKLRDGGVTWIIWGKRKLEGSGKFPNGGWARIDSIKMGKWKPWHPRPILIPAESFMEKDHDKQSHWITLAPGMAIQGLLAERNGELRNNVLSKISGIGFVIRVLFMIEYLLSNCHNNAPSQT